MDHFDGFRVFQLLFKFFLLPFAYSLTTYASEKGIMEHEDNWEDGRLQSLQMYNIFIHKF